MSCKCEQPVGINAGICGRCLLPMSEKFNKGLAYGRHSIGNQLDKKLLNLAKEVIEDLDFIATEINGSENGLPTYHKEANIEMIRLVMAAFQEVQGLK